MVERQFPGALPRNEPGSRPRLAVAPVEPVPPVPERIRRGYETCERLLENLEKVVRGKREELGLVVCALACEGHVLFEDVPGTAKTVLARAIAQSIAGATPSRIQCTPDLQPADVTGSAIFDQRTRDFEFRAGPIFANVVLVDEINRATPKTQSALLEAMAERQVTVDGVTRPLPGPFLVLATENPVEQDGTFVLPEAQLDRFLLRTALGYPDAKDEHRIIVDQRHGHPLDELDRCRQDRATSSSCSGPRRTCTSIRCSSAGSSRWFARPGSSRSSSSERRCEAASRSSGRSGRRALLDGREYAVPEDVKELFGPVIGHRVLLGPAYLAGTRHLRREQVRLGPLGAVPGAGPTAGAPCVRERGPHLPAPPEAARRGPTVRRHAGQGPRPGVRPRGLAALPAG